MGSKWTKYRHFFSTTKVGHRRIFLFTNEDNPNGENEANRDRSVQRARDLSDLGIDIELFSMNKPGKVFDPSVFYQVNSDTRILTSRQIQYLKFKLTTHTFPTPTAYFSLRIYRPSLPLRRTKMERPSILMHPLNLKSWGHESEGRSSRRDLQRKSSSCSHRGWRLPSGRELVRCRSVITQL